MEQGEKVKWFDSGGFEHTGVVDWEAPTNDTQRIPIRTKENIIVWVERRNVKDWRNIKEE